MTHVKVELLLTVDGKQERQFVFYEGYTDTPAYGSKVLNEAQDKFSKIMFVEWAQKKGGE